MLLICNLKFFGFCYEEIVGWYLTELNGRAIFTRKNAITTCKKLCAETFLLLEARHKPRGQLSCKPNTKINM